MARMVIYIAASMVACMAETLECRLRVRVPSHGSFFPVNTFLKLCSGQKASLAARPYFVFASGCGRKVGSSRMCKFHTSQ